MCFSNLPIEFDENGDPYLAEAAEAVHQPGCGCDADADLAELDPEAAFEDIVESVPDDVRRHLEDGAAPDERSGRAGGD